jgi:glycosyltransferase involved in cell wall biosynthesis
VAIVCPRVVATFTRQDLAILQSEFDASLFPFEGITSLRRLRQEIHSSDAVIIWFAGRHAGPAIWFARQREIPVITIVGGYEAVWIPEIHYGIPVRSIRGRILRWVLKYSNAVVAVSEATKRGLSARHPEVMPKTTRISNAVDTRSFRPGAEGNRQGVLSVGIINHTTVKVKGWRLFWETAARLPDVPFIAVGPAVDREGRDLVSRHPPNLLWLGGRYGENLVQQYQAAAVYFQGSVHESFSLALAESMSCGCIPVVSRNGALPEVAGDIGYYLEELSVEAAVTAIIEALKASPEKRVAARQRIVAHFDYQRRCEALCRLVRETIASRKR